METSPLTTKTIKQLEKIPEIIKIETKNSNQSTVYEMTIQGNDLDIRPLISEVIVKSGAKLYTIKQGEKMLERAYIEALKDKNGEKS